MSVDQRKSAPVRPPLPDGRRETWVYLADWPMPEDGERAVEVELKEYRFRGRELELLREGIKLCYLFAGAMVATKRTSRGLTVLNADAEGGSSERLHAWLFALPPEESSNVLLHFIEDPHEERQVFI